jgi:predicted dehydrogenase
MSVKKICVVGAGNWGLNHIKTLDSMNCLGGFIEKDDTLRGNIKRKFPKAKSFKSLDESFLEKDFEGYVVATPAKTHHKLSLKIINAKKHLLVEKPISFSVDEVQDLQIKSKKNKINLMVGHLLLFHPAIIKIKELIDGGKIGEIKYIYSNRLNFGKVRSAENVFWSFAPHDISIFQFLIESYPQKIGCTGNAILQKSIQDSTITTLTYNNGISGHIFHSWLHPFKEHRLVVIGDKGMISFEDSKENKPLVFYSKKIEIINSEIESIDQGEEKIAYPMKSPLTEELSYFINHLDGKKLKINNADDALEVTKILSEASTQLAVNLKSNNKNFSF